MDLSGGTEGNGTERNRTDSKQLHGHGVVVVVHFYTTNLMYVVSMHTFANVGSVNAYSNVGVMQ